MIPVNISGDSPLYCCDFGYNNTSKKCQYGGANPFPLPIGNIIYNRTSGSISSNTTAAITTSSTTPIPSSSGNEIGIGAGVGIPLGIALLAAVVMFWSERRQRKQLQKRVDESLKGTPGSSLPDTQPVPLYQGQHVRSEELEEGQIQELDGSHRHEVGVHE